MCSARRELFGMGELSSAADRVDAHGLLSVLASPSEVSVHPLDGKPASGITHDKYGLVSEPA
jgi:hypothetical protein